MQKSSKITLIVAALMLLIGSVFLLVGRAPEPTPEESITQSLRDVEAAARTRSVGGVMEVISDDFKWSGWNKDRLRFLVLRSIQQSRGVEYNARVNTPRILPSPKQIPTERLVVSKLAVFYSGSGEDIWGTGPLTFVMRKEYRRKWLFFQEPRWRIVGLATAPSLPGYSGDNTTNPFGL